MQAVDPYLNPELALIDDIASFYDDPLGFVIYAYPWGSDPALRTVKLVAPWNMLYNSEYGPDAWACEILHEIGEQVKERGFDGVHAVLPLLFAIASGHGIGKSALVAWIVDWIMSTRPHAKGVVTANTAPQLETKTWAEIAKWTKKCITGHWFDVTTGRGSMSMKHKQHPESWRCDAQTCKEENSEAFAGLHAADSTAFYIFDEGSGVPNKIHEVSEGGMTDGEPMKFAFGNPTQNSGWFADVFKKLRHRWNTRQIDSRTVQITNKKLLQNWIDDYGIDSDFCKVRIRGMFPSMSSRQFISVADVDAAFGRELKPEQYQWAPKIITCDPSWEGDDELVIGMRQGLYYQTLRTIAKNDNDLQIANILANLEDEHAADAVFIDAGYGTGIYSAGKTMHRDWMLVWFGGKSDDPGYLNKRAEIWKKGRDWLKAGGAIPPDPVLHDELISVETVGRADGIVQLESKKDMKKRGLPSPNRSDALMISFAYPVEKRDRRAEQALIEQFTPGGALDNTRQHYDPYDRLRKAMS